LILAAAGSTVKQYLLVVGLLRWYATRLSTIDLDSVPTGFKFQGFKNNDGRGKTVRHRSAKTARVFNGSCFHRGVVATLNHTPARKRVAVRDI